MASNQAASQLKQEKERAANRYFKPKSTTKPKVRQGEWVMALSGRGSLLWAAAGSKTLAYQKLLISFQETRKTFSENT